VLGIRDLLLALHSDVGEGGVGTRAARRSPALSAIRGFFQDCGDVALEVLALRQQLAVLKRKRPRPPLNALDRLFWTTLSRFWARWMDVLEIVKSKTVVGWHRAGFRLYWRRHSRTRGGRPKITQEIRALIRQMAEENVGWGAPKIHGELLKIGSRIVTPSSIAIRNTVAEVVRLRDGIGEESTKGQKRERPLHQTELPPLEPESEKVSLEVSEPRQECFVTSSSVWVLSPCCVRPRSSRSHPFWHSCPTKVPQGFRRNLDQEILLSITLAAKFIVGVYNKFAPPPRH